MDTGYKEQPALLVALLVNLIRRVKFGLANNSTCTASKR